MLPVDEIDGVPINTQESCGQYFWECCRLDFILLIENVGKNLWLTLRYNQTELVIDILNKQFENSMIDIIGKSKYLKQEFTPLDFAIFHQNEVCCSTFSLYLH